MCSLKNKPADKPKKQEKELIEEKAQNKQRLEINKNERIMIFHKKAEVFPTLEYFLQTYSRAVIT